MFYSVIDLTHPIEQDMPVFPGTEKPSFKVSSNMTSHGFTERRLSICSHTGTHIDAPSHLIKNGDTIDLLGVEHFIGKALMIPVQGKKFITIEDIIPYQAILEHCSFVLFASGWDKYWGDPNYLHGYPVLAQDAAHWLGQFKLKGVGMDTISIDAPEDRSLPVHHILFSKEMLLVENLKNLELLPTTPFTFSCLPLPISGGDGSPVRAIAMLDQ